MKKLLVVLWVNGVVFITAALMLLMSAPAPAQAAGAYQDTTPVPQVTVVMTELIPNTGADPGPQNVFLSGWGWAILIFLGAVLLLGLLALMMRPAASSHHHDTHDNP